MKNNVLINDSKTSFFCQYRNTCGVMTSPEMPSKLNEIILGVNSLKIFFVLFKMV